jgi:hypothetical protein
MACDLDPTLERGESRILFHYLKKMCNKQQDFDMFLALVLVMLKNTIN